MRPVPTEPCLGLVKAFEGSGGKFLATRAQDPSGNWAIGWGHDLTGSLDPLWNATLTEQQADDLAIKDLTGAATAVSGALSAPVAGPTTWDATQQKNIPGTTQPLVNTLTNGQYAALIDFTYNVGPGAFRTSTLCHFVQNGNLAGVPTQLALWVHEKINGVETVMAGLVRRRQAEIKCWLT